jgi:hypothetical protein
MEHISEILKRQSLLNMNGTKADKDRDTEAEEPEPAELQ